MPDSDGNRHGSTVIARVTVDASPTRSEAELIGGGVPLACTVTGQRSPSGQVGWSVLSARALAGWRVDILSAGISSWNPGPADIFANLLELPSLCTGSRAGWSIEVQGLGIHADIFANDSNYHYGARLVGTVT